eukprot:jgi/Mesvir1/17425/Mv08706-RA.2
MVSKVDLSIRPRSGASSQRFGTGAEAAWLRRMVADESYVAPPPTGPAASTAPTAGGRAEGSSSAHPGYVPFRFCDSAGLPPSEVRTPAHAPSHALLPSSNLDGVQPSRPHVMTLDVAAAVGNREPSGCRPALAGHVRRHKSLRAPLDASPAPRQAQGPRDNLVVAPSGRVDNAKQLQELSWRAREPRDALGASPVERHAPPSLRAVREVSPSSLPLQPCVADRSAAGFRGKVRGSPRKRSAHVGGDSSPERGASQVVTSPPRGGVVSPPRGGAPDGGASPPLFQLAPSHSSSCRRGHSGRRDPLEEAERLLEELRGRDGAAQGRDTEEGRGGARGARGQITARGPAEKPSRLDESIGGEEDEGPSKWQAIRQRSETQGALWKSLVWDGSSRAPGRQPGGYAGPSGSQAATEQGPPFSEWLASATTSASATATATMRGVSAGRRAQEGVHDGAADVLPLPVRGGDAPLWDAPAASGMPGGGRPTPTLDNDTRAMLEAHARAALHTAQMELRADDSPPHATTGEGSVNAAVPTRGGELRQLYGDHALGSKGWSDGSGVDSPLALDSLTDTSTEMMSPPAGRRLPGSHLASPHHPTSGRAIPGSVAPPSYREAPAEAVEQRARGGHGRQAALHPSSTTHQQRAIPEGRSAQGAVGVPTQTEAWPRRPSLSQQQQVPRREPLARGDAHPRTTCEPTQPPEAKKAPAQQRPAAQQPHRRQAKAGPSSKVSASKILEDEVERLRHFTRAQEKRRLEEASRAAAATAAATPAAATPAILRVAGQEASIAAASGDTHPSLDEVASPRTDELALRDERVLAFATRMAMRGLRRCLTGAFAIWRDRCRQAQAAQRKAQVFATWTCQMRTWREWKLHHQRARTERENQAWLQRLQEEKEAERRAEAHHAARMLSVALLRWLAHSRLARSEKEVQRQHTLRQEKMQRLLLAKAAAQELAAVNQHRQQRQQRHQKQQAVAPPPGTRPASAATSAALPPSAAHRALDDEHDGSVDSDDGALAVGHVLRVAEAEGAAERASRGSDVPKDTTGNMEQSQAAAADGGEPSASAPSQQRSQASGGARVVHTSPEGDLASEVALETSAPHDDAAVGPREGGGSHADRGNPLDTWMEDAAFNARVALMPPAEAMAARAERRRQRRQLLQDKYARAQQAKEEAARLAEQQATTEELRQRAALREQKKEKERAEAQARERAAQRSLLAAHQAQLADMHYARRALQTYAWAPWSKLVEQSRNRVAVAVLARTGRLLRCWQLAVRQERQQQVTAAGRQHVRWLLRRCLRAWSMLTGAQALYCSALVLRAWSALAQAISSRQRAEEEAATHHAGWQARRAWDGWCTLWLEGRDARLLAELEQLHAARGHATKYRMRGVLRAWRQLAADGTLEREKEERRQVVWGKIQGWLEERSVASTLPSEEDIVANVLQFRAAAP